jgi:hypothetical protein
MLSVLIEQLIARRTILCIPYSLLFVSNSNSGWSLCSNFIIYRFRLFTPTIRDFHIYIYIYIPIWGSTKHIPKRLYISKIIILYRNNKWREDKNECLLFSYVSVHLFRLFTYLFLLILYFKLYFVNRESYIANLLLYRRNEKYIMYIFLTYLSRQLSIQITMRRRRYSKTGNRATSQPHHLDDDDDPELGTTAVSSVDRDPCARVTLTEVTCRQVQTIWGFKSKITHQGKKSRAPVSPSSVTNALSFQKNLADQPSSLANVRRFRRDPGKTQPRFRLEQTNIHGGWPIAILPVDCPADLNLLRAKKSSSNGRT